MSDDKKVSDEDRALFRDSIGGVKRVKSDRVDLSPPAPPPRRRYKLHSGIQRAVDGLTDHLMEEGPDSDEVLLFARSGVQPKTLRQLKRGQLAVQADLDMHGMTVDEGRQHLVMFLDECRQLGLRCVCIIHGKGYRSPGVKPKLKGMVNSWLRQRPDVLAFCSAQPADGGTGSVYVLLKQG